MEIQEGMDEFLRTAALRKKPGIDVVFQWLQRRQISVVLLTKYRPEELEVLLERLNWKVGAGNLIAHVVTEQDNIDNPVISALKVAGLSSPHTTLVIVDTPRLLHAATAAGCHLVLGVTDGSCSYQELAGAPFRVLLDNVIQLPNYLLRTLPAALVVPGMDRRTEFFWPNSWFRSLE